MQLDPWDLGVLSFADRSTVSRMYRCSVGSIYFITGRASHWVGLSDGSIHYAGRYSDALRILLHHVEEAMYAAHW